MTGTRRAGLFGTPNTFSETYPTVEQIKVEVHRLGYCGIDESNKLCIFDKASVRPTISCPNRICKGGGFSIEHLLWSTITAGRAHAEGGGKCSGHEGRSRDCSNCFSVKIDVVYKSEASTDG